jgi:hypothetical protein
MSDLNENTKTPSIDQLSEQSRQIYYKEHEFLPELERILAEIDLLLSNTNQSELYVLFEEIKSLFGITIEEMNEIIALMESYLNIIDIELINVDSAYERLYQKILADIFTLNNNLKDRIALYDVPSSYNTDLKKEVYTKFGKKSPYVDGRVNADLDDKWIVKNQNSVIMLRDMDIGNRMITFPLVVDPNLEQTTNIKLFSFTPNLNKNDEPVFLAEIILNGDLFAFKGYLKSENKDRSGKRGAVFDAQYAVSYDLPYRIKVAYDDENNKIIVLFKYDETPDKLLTLIKIDFSVHLLVGKDLVIEKINTILEEPIAI